MVERLQKIIARAGICSRRAAEELIRNGRVRVNGRVITELGFQADPRRDKVEVDNKRLDAENLVYVVLHKPRGYVSTLDDPEGRPTVTELIREIPERLHPVGRLDFATSGVLLLTNDGDFTHKLLHPSAKAPKTYVVKLDRVVDEVELEPWRNGMELDDGMTLPAAVRLLRHENGKSWIEVTLREGRNQQLRRMAARQGMVAMRLARITFAGIDSTDLRPGEWRPLSVDELRALQRAHGVPKRVRPQLALVELHKKLQEKRALARKRKKGPAGRKAAARKPVAKHAAPKRAAAPEPSAKPAGRGRPAREGRTARPSRGRR